MNGLLKSKTFKRNIGRWLVMYFGVLGLFATVVTYSKYVSKFEAVDFAKAAKFIVKVSYLDKCEGQTMTCSYSSQPVRPTSTYEYLYEVDTTELEVTTVLVTSVQIHLGLTDINLYEYTDNGWELIPSTSYSLTTVENQTTHLPDYKLLSKSDTISMSDPLRKNVRKYKITAKWDSNVDIPASQFRAITVGYSATQQK